MKNMLLILVFLIGIAVMFCMYFVPNINKKNNIDQLKYTLWDIRERIPDSSKVYFFTEALPNETEIYYKAQFVLAPRTTVMEEFGKIPRNAYLIVLQNEQGKDSILKSPAFSARTAKVFDSKDVFFRAVLLKKIQ